MALYSNLQTLEPSNLQTLEPSNLRTLKPSNLQTLLFNMASIFTRIVNGEIPCHKVAETADYLAFLDVRPQAKGHTLCVPKKEIDYLFDLGVTTLWLNPIWENDMPNRTEHGYAFTNHYKVDPRLGGDKAYADLIDAAHKKGLKVMWALIDYM